MCKDIVPDKLGDLVCTHCIERMVAYLALCCHLRSTRQQNLLHKSYKAYQERSSSLKKGILEWEQLN